MSPSGASYFASYVDLPTCSNCEKPKGLKPLMRVKVPEILVSGSWRFSFLLYVGLRNIFPGCDALDQDMTKNWQLGLKLTIACIISYIFIANGYHH